MRYTKLAINLCILSVVFIFFAQNYEILKLGIQMQIGFFFSTPYYFPPIPLYMLLLLVFLLAMLFTFFYTLKERFALKSQLRKSEKIIREQEEELVSLRMLPLREGTHHSSSQNALSSDAV